MVGMGGDLSSWASFWDAEREGLAESLPVPGVGYGAGWVGPYPAVVAFAAVIGGLGLLSALLAVRR